MARFDLTRNDLGHLLVDEPAYRVTQVWDGLIAGLNPEDITTLPKALRARLGADHAVAASLEPALESVSDRGDTTKWLWRLHDGHRIETVLMHYPDRVTVCVSTQAGCAMGCGFCATGQAGFARQLTVGEIVEQAVRARTRAAASGRRLANVVFMGMGEPLANLDRVEPAVRFIHAELGLSARHITVSTVGIVPGIRRLAGIGLPITLAVSLHAADDETRDELVPINRRYPLAMLADACAEFVQLTGRRLTIEWALIADVNDTDRQADLLAAWARPLKAHVNLIPLNPTPGYPAMGSSAVRVVAFADRLLAQGINATVRHNRGTDIAAACGQLAAGAPTTASVVMGVRR